MEDKNESIPKIPTLPSKRLLFDRRYGWVVDEWKDPSEVALAGGRGMFCVLPLAKGLLKMASDSFAKFACEVVNLVTNQLDVKMGVVLKKLSYVTAKQYWALVAFSARVPVLL